MSDKIVVSVYMALIWIIAYHVVRGLICVACDCWRKRKARRNAIEDLPPSPFSEELIISAARTAREDLLVGIGEPTASLLEIKKKLDAIERVVNRLENDEISDGN